MVALRPSVRKVLWKDSAEALDVRFVPFVLYTYGGFHRSALTTIEQMGGGQ